MDQKQEQKITMRDLNLLKIKDIALNLYKSNAPDPRKDSEAFLVECWVESVVAELNRKGLTDIHIKRDHKCMILDEKFLEDEES